jgi:hypothetical protein
MAHTVSGLIRKAPHIQAGENNNGNYTMFCFELAEFNKGTQGKEDSYTNYSVALFAKSQGAIDFHGKAIAEGSFVVVNCDKLMVEKQTSKQDGREFIKLKMMNASLGDFNNPNQQQQQAAPQQQGGFQQAPQQYQQQAPAQYQQGQGFQPQQPPQQQGGYQNQPGK